MRLIPALALLAGMAQAQVVASTFSPDARTTQPSVESTAPAVPSLSAPGKPLPDLLPQPSGKPTLIGGTITRTDSLRDEITIRIFGGGKTRILFDSRTHIYRDEAPVSARTLQTGEHVHVDTLLAGKDIFAQNIRVVTQGLSGQSTGQVVSFNPASGELVVNDSVFPHEVTMHILPNTVIRRDGQPVSADEVVAGTLVSAAFQPGRNSAVKELNILATPGHAFVFVGQVLHLDLHLGLLVVVDPRDQKTYEINFAPGEAGFSANLQEGATVAVTATFDGTRYMASAIQVQAPSSR